MNQTELKTGGHNDMTAIAPVASAALAIGCVKKITKMDLDEESAVNAAASLLGMAYLTGKDKKTFKDRIYIFFSENDKKSIVTLYESSIRRIQIYADGSGTYPKSYTMLAVLNKVIVGQSKKCKAERRIGLSEYRHSWEGKDGASPQVTLLISGKDYKRRTETNFTPQSKQRLVMSLRSKKYVEYIPIVEDKRSFSHIEKALELSINKDSFLSILLKKYILQEEMELNATEAIFLVENYLHRIPKGTLSLLKKAVKKLNLKCTTKGINGDRLKDIDKLCKSLEKTTPPYETFPLSANSHKSLQRDILELVRERARQYENLHEALTQDTYSNILSLGTDEIVACYPHKAHSQTSALLKKCILQDKGLSQKMGIIHGYIDNYKKRVGSKFSISSCPSIQQSASDSYALGVLCEYINDRSKETEYKVDSIVECAQERVAKKYSSSYLQDIDGITEKVTANISKMSVRTEKPKAVPEASIFEIDPVVEGWDSSIKR